MLAEEIPMFELRRQDTKNRQNSIDDIDEFTKQDIDIKVKKHFEESMKLYKQLLDQGIAKECARFVLPLATPTRIYMTGSLPIMDSLYRSTFCTWNAERTHGHC